MYTIDEQYLWDQQEMFEEDYEINGMIQINGGIYYV